MRSRPLLPGEAAGTNTTCSPPAETGSTGALRNNNPSARPTAIESKDAQTLLSNGTVSDA